MMLISIEEETDTTVHQLTSSSLITSARNRPRTTTFFAGMATTEASTPIDGATRPDNHTAEEDLQPNNQTPVIQPLRLAQHPGPDDQVRIHNVKSFLFILFHNIIIEQSWYKNIKKMKWNIVFKLNKIEKECQMGMLGYD